MLQEDVNKHWQILQTEAATKPTSVTKHLEYCNIKYIKPTATNTLGILLDWNCTLCWG